MKNFNLLKILLLAFAVLFTAGITAKAIDAPNAPAKLTVTQQDNNYNQNVVLYWVFEPNHGTQPDLFIVYKAEKVSSDLADFKRLDYVRAQNSLEYKHLVTLAPGTYSFYVTAAAIDGNTIVESTPSQIVTVEIKGNNHEPYIRIVSEPPTFAEIGQGYIYHLKFDSNINCPIDQFSLIGEVPDGMTIDANGIIRWTPTKEGQFAVTVTAGTSCKINVQPAAQKFLITVGNHNNNAYIKFSSQINPEGKVGEEYIYEIITESNVKCPTLFEIVIHPMDGVTIDKEKGIIRIMTNTPMVYTGYVKAYLQCDEKTHAIQQFSIKFGENNDHKPCGIVRGYVNYNDNTPVPEAKIKFWYADKNNHQTTMFIAYVKDGMYSINLPEGVYIADIDGPLVHEFWKNAETADKAERITVKCSTHTVVNFDVAKHAQPHHFTVSGRVTKESDGSPVITAVEFIPLEFINGKIDLNGNYYTQFITKTDHEGYYKITLPDIYTYYAHAVQPINSDLLDQYYDGADTHFEADILELTEDLMNIDFKLKARLNHVNSFTGFVRDINGNAVKSRVFAHLVKVSNSNNTPRFSQQVETNLEGEFIFKNLIPGEYVLLSIPYDKKFVPGYFKMGFFAVLKWKEATRVAVPNMLTVIYEIKHRERTGLKGIIKVDGVVTDLSGTIRKSGEVPLNNNSGLAGAFAYVLDENGDISDYAFTDNNGFFEMIEVSAGGNTLIIDKAGYSGYEQSLVNDYEKNYSSKLNIGLDKEEISEVIDGQLNSDGFALYPFPASSSATLQFEGSGINGQLVIYNTMGMQIQSMNFNSVEGLNQIKIDLNGINSGNYLLRIDLGGKSSVVPMLISR